ncbi:MAG: hypothetical protein AAF429_15705 [Pseudomonadota bacterium]
MIRALPLLFALGACPAVKASGAEEVFSCPVKNGTKQVLVRLEGDVFQYRFGTKDRAELELTAALEDAYTPWAGVGRYIYESVNFENAGFDYSVYFSVDRNDLDADPELGLIVTKGDEEVARLECDPKTGQSALFDLTVMLEENGHCWDFDNRVWKTCAK